MSTDLLTMLCKATKNRSLITLKVLELDQVVKQPITELYCFLQDTRHLNR